jgi:hypothetical protein
MNIKFKIGNSTVTFSDIYGSDVKPTKDDVPAQEQYIRFVSEEKSNKVTKYFNRFYKVNWVLCDFVLVNGKLTREYTVKLTKSNKSLNQL